MACSASRNMDEKKNFAETRCPLLDFVASKIKRDYKVWNYTVKLMLRVSTWDNTKFDGKIQ